MLCLISQKLRLAQWTLALVAFAEPLHYAVGVELLLARLARFLGGVALGVHDVETDRAFLNTGQFLVDVLFPQQNAVDDGVVPVVQLGLEHEGPLAAVFHLESFAELNVNRSENK